METTVLPTHSPSLVDDEIDDSSTVLCDDIDDAKNNTLDNGIDKFLCHVDRVVDPIIDSGDAMLQTNSFYDFFFGWLGGSSGSDSCRCWDDESTIFTAWTEYSACTGYSACTDYSAYTGYSACTDYASAVTLICVGEDEKWSSVLGFLGRVFDQDVFNMPKVQAGLESTYKPGVTLSGYQEGKVRWLHHKLSEWIGE